MTNIEMSSDEELINRQQVAKAVDALYQYVAKKQSSTLIDEPDKINLQFTFRKASTIKKVIRIPLPSTLTTKTSEVCLFVKDVDRKERDYSATVRHYKDLLSDKGVSSVTEVIPLKSVKLEYQPFEAKRNLSNSFDVYLADERIVRLLPKSLGKHFYGKKKFPVAVKLTANNLKKEINDKLSCAQCILTGRGSSCQVTVAHTDLSQEQTVDNIIAAAQRIAANVPGGVNNVKIMHIRTHGSPALTIYANLSSSVDVELPKKKVKLELDEPEEVTTVMHGKVRVTPYGHVEVVNKGSLKRKANQSRGISKSKRRTKLTRGKLSGKKKIKVKSEPKDRKTGQMRKRTSRKRKLQVKTE